MQQEKLIRQARYAPGWAEWAAEQQRLEQTRIVSDTERLGRILGQFVDPCELREAVGAVRAAGFHR